MNWPPPAPWHDLRRAARRLHFRADEAVRGAIAGRLDLEAVKSLEAEIAVGPWLDGVEISGRVLAVVTRVCGVSLDPFDEAVDEAIRLRLVPHGSRNAPRRDAAGLVTITDEEDPPEEVAGGAIDLAGYLEEHLALGLTPFPRMPEASFEPPSEAGAPSAFAALAALRRPPDEA